MTFRRGAAWLGGGAVMAAWLVGAAAPSLAPERPDGPTGQPPPEGDRQALALVVEAARIRERLDGAVALRPLTRNPFRFAPRLSELRQEPLAPETTPAAPVLAPRLALLGVAEEAPGAANPGRTAILQFAGDLWLVGEGEPVGTRYRVTRIAPESVELEDLAEARTVRVALP